MFQTAVPVKLSSIPDYGTNAHLEQLILKLQAINADIVFLGTKIPDNLEWKCQKINTVAAVLHHAGLKVGVWIGCFGHISYDGMGFTRMTDLNGNENSILTCPSDQAFSRYYGSLVAQLATCQIDAIMLDDDFRINFNNRLPLCFCHNHLNHISQRLGENVTLDILRSKLLTGATNRYRTAWMEANQHFLTEFSRDIRRAVDNVKPELPVLLASGPALWGLDVSTPMQIAQILAGSGQPVSIRLSSGPYWPMFFPKLRLAPIIELIRREAAYCRQVGISAFAEGDTYPRPRYEVPASQLELYELACRADGNAAGILKYVFDYVASLSYETGYVDAAVKNQLLYQHVEQAFFSKIPVGLSVFAPFSFTENFVGMNSAPTPDVESASVYVPAIQMLTDNSIPSHFEPRGPGIVFGNDASKLPLDRLKDGWILDLPAAKALTARGVDVGLREDLGAFHTCQDNTWLIHNTAYLLKLSEQEFCPVAGPDIHKLSVDSSAEILSTYAQGQSSCPGEYRYENQQHQRFVVFPFDAFREQHKIGMFRNYYRQKELVDAYQWLSGQKLDAVCTGHPDLYLMAKKDGDSITVGLWNFSLDAIESPVIDLADQYKELETVNCTGTLSGNQVTLSRLGAQEFCCFTAKVKF